MTDFFDINLSLLGWPHTAACLVAMAAFFPVMFARKGGKTHRRWGRIYAIAYAVLCVTSLGIYRLNRFFFPHWLALAGLVVLSVGYLAVRYKPRAWRGIHLTAMLLSASNLFGGAINEAFLRIKPLQDIGGIRAPMVSVLQAIFGNLFMVLIVFYLVAEFKRRYRERARHVQDAADGG